MTNFNTVPIEDLYESTLQSDLGEIDMVAKTVKIITGTLTGGATTYMGINYDRPSKYELVEISAINGQDVTIVTRALPTKSGGTGTAQNHPAGSKVIITHNYKVFEDIQTAINSKADASAPTIDEPTFTDWVKLPSYANAAARDVAIPTPQKDMTVILDNDGDGKRCLTLYSGSAWTNITLPGRNVTIDGFLIVAGGYVRFPVYANDAARNAAIPTPVQSMVVYNQTAVTLQLYDGANWIDLDIGTPVPLATTTVAGRVELATDAEVLAGTNTSGSNPLVMQPSQLALGNIIQATLEKDLTAGTLVGISNMISQSTTFVNQAFVTDINVTFPQQVDLYIARIPLDSTRLLIVYYTTSTTTLRAVVATWNYATDSITLGTEQTISTGPFLVSGGTPTAIAVQSTTDKVVVSYVLNATPTVVNCKILDMTGASISVGAERTLYTAPSALGNPSGLKMCNIGTNKLQLMVVPTTTTNTRTLAFTVSGTTVTAGAVQTPDATLQALSATLVKLNTDKFFIGISGTTANFQVGTVSGTTTTLTALQTFAAGGAAVGVFAELTTNKLVYAYGTGASIDRLTTIDCPATTITVGGSPVTVAGSSGFTVLVKSETDFIYGYNSGSDTRYFQCSNSGTTITATEATRINFTFEAVLNSRYVNISLQGTTVIPFRREGMAVNQIGILNTGGSRGATVNVQLKSPRLSGLSNLRAGEFYSTFAPNVTSGTPSLVSRNNSAVGDRPDEQNALLVAITPTSAISS